MESPQWNFGHRKTTPASEPSASVSFVAPESPVVPAQPVSPPVPDAGAAPTVAEMLADINSVGGGSGTSVFNDAEGENFSIHPILKQSIEWGASDVMIAGGRRPVSRVNGRMRQMTDFPVLTPGECDRLIRSILKDSQLGALDKNWELDCSYELDGYRFRVNVHFQMHGLAAVFRLLGEKIFTPEQLGISDSIMKLCDLDQGLVIVTGPTGSGKTTTLATMIDKINREKSYHILTIEDPVEIVHQELYDCVITHRELGTHTQSFDNALRSALREAPNVILVGEMRDFTTIALALTAAETGHLVFATLHTMSASETVNRIIDVFPAEQQSMVRAQLAGSLRAVVSQKLLFRIPKGRVAAREVMICNNAIANQIRTSRTHEIYSSIQSGAQEGMKTMEENLAELVRDGLVEYDHAKAKANDEKVFDSYLTAKLNKTVKGGR